MGGLVRNLFGGSEQDQSSSSRPIDVTPGPFKGLRQPIADVIGSLLGGQAFAGLPVSAPTGVASLGTGENAFLAALNQFSQPTALQGQARDLLSSTISGRFLDPASNPFLQATIQAAQRPVIEAFRDVALPRLQGQFTAGGHRIQPEGSSAFDNAAAIATRGLTNALGDISTNISGQNFQAERGRQATATQQVEQLTAQDLTNTVQGLQAAALPRLIEQFGIDQGVQEFNRRIQTILQAISLAAGLPVSAFGQQSQGQGSGTSTGGIIPGLSGFVRAGFPGGF